MPLSFQELFSNTWGIVLAVLFFGGSIFVHELGHFLAARWRGLKVERFSIGMGPRVFGWTGKDGVDYRVSLFPIGGYVALPQMADMSGVEGETEETAEKLPPISYADKMWVAVAGAVFNVIFALLLACILWKAGMPMQEGTETTVVGHVDTTIGAGGTLADLGAADTVPGPAHVAGVRAGDRILKIDGASVTNWQQVNEAILLGNRKDAAGKPTCVLTIERAGQTIDITVSPALVEFNSTTKDRIRVTGMEPRTSVLLGTPLANSPAALAGLKAEDEVLTVDGQTVHGADSFIDLLRVKTPGPRQLGIRRGEQTLSVAVQPVPVLRTNPIGAITHGDSGEFRVVLIPVPDEAAKDKVRLVVHSATGDSATTEALSLGTVLDKADGREIIALRSLDDLVDVATPGGRDLSVFWKRSGAEGNLILRKATARVVQPAPTPSIGADIRSRAVITHRTPIEQFVGAFWSTINTLTRLFDRGSDIHLNQLMGAISIAKMYVNLSEDIRLVIWFSVVININLAILNLLPIPVLDGGHMLLATVERIRRKPLPSKAVIWVQYVFVAFFMALMAYVLLNDVRRCSGDGDARLRSELLQKHVIRNVEFK